MEETEKQDDIFTWKHVLLIGCVLGIIFSLALYFWLCSVTNDLQIETQKGIAFHQRID